MGLPTVTQTWTISPNNRYVFSTVIGATGSLIFSLTQFLLNTMGYTCKGSSNGTTAAMDGVNRITSSSTWATRNNGSAGAQSWIVVTDGNGIDWCFSYNSASDDIVRLAHSQGGNYVAAGTTTNQPTAVDEAFDVGSGSWVNATASADRVWHLWATTDKKMFRFSVYRQSVCISYICGEKLNDTLVSPATFSLTTGGGTKGAIKSFFNSFISIWIGSTIDYTSSFGDISRVHANGIDTNSLCCRGLEVLARQASGGALYQNEKPQLQGGTGELFWPINTGRAAANPDGKLGNIIDAWATPTNNASIPGPGETFGNLQFIAVGGSLIVVPWDGTTIPVIA